MPVYPRAKLTNLLDAMDEGSMAESGDYVFHYDRLTGNTVMIERVVLEMVENGDEDAVSALADWQRSECEIAGAIVNGKDPNRFIEPPSKRDFHEYRHMERFIRTVAAFSCNPRTIRSCSFPVGQLLSWQSFQTRQKCHGSPPPDAAER